MEVSEVVIPVIVTVIFDSPIALVTVSVIVRVIVYVPGVGYE